MLHRPDKEPPVRHASTIELTREERAKPSQLARSGTTTVRLARRAQRVLLAADGVSNAAIAKQVDCGACAGRTLAHAPCRRRPGSDRARPAARRTDAPSPTADAAEIVRLTTRTTPEAATQWSTRSLAAKVGVSDTTVLRVWRKHGLRPHLVRGFNISRDAKFIVKLEDIMELYMAPPEHALALCCDEKSQVQALVLHS